MKAIIKATNEKINVYRLNNGNYYDYDNMGENMPPAAIKSGKKEFSKDELNIIDNRKCGEYIKD